MHANHIARAAGHGGDRIEVLVRGVARQNRAGTTHRIELAKHVLLDAEILEYRLDNQVRSGDIGKIRGDAYPCQALVQLRLGEASARAARFPGITHARESAPGRSRVHFEHRHRQAVVGKIDRDARTHGAATDHCHRNDRAPRHRPAIRRQPGRRTLGKKQVPQRARLGGVHQLHKDFAGARCGFRGRAADTQFNRVDDTLRRRGTARALRRHLPLRREPRGVDAREIRHDRPGRARLRSCRYQFARIVQRGGTQITIDDAIEQTHLQRHGGRYRLALDHEVQRGLHSHQPRCALGAAGTGQQPQFHLRQADARLAQCNPIVRRHRGFEPAAERIAVYRHDDRLAERLELIEHLG